MAKNFYRTLIVAALIINQSLLFAETSSKAKKAEKLITAGDLPAAVEIYKELMAKNTSKNPELVKEGREGMAKIQVIKARSALKDKNYADAEKTAKETIAAYSDTASMKDAYATLVQIRAEVAVRYFNAGRYDDEIALIRETAAAVPADTAGLKELTAAIAKSQFAAASASLQAKDYPKALNYAVAISTGPLAKEDPIAVKSNEMIAKIGKELLAAAESQIKAGKYDDAITAVTLALTTGGDDAFVAQAKYDIGLAHRFNNHPEKALASYGDVVEKYKTTPYAPAAAYDMYLIYIARGEKDDALASITAAANLNVDNVDYLFIRADLLKETGAVAEAKTMYTRLLDILQSQIQKTYTNKEKLQYRLGLAYVNLERYAEAAVEFNKAIIRNPSYTEAREGLSLAQFKGKNFAAAAQNYETLIRQSTAEYDKFRDAVSKKSEPADDQRLEHMRLQIAYYHYRNGLCYEQLGDLDKAEQECGLGLEGVSTKEAADTMQRIGLAKSARLLLPAPPAPAAQPVSTQK